MTGCTCCNLRSATIHHLYDYYDILSNWLQGQPGESGDEGMKGEIGLKGAKGEKGSRGNRGLPGPQGNKGIPGMPGEAGLPGPDVSTSLVVVF